MSLPDPITRREQYLNIAAGGTGSLPPRPITREEQYLAAIAEGGGLPPVTSADNGKVLGVEDGSWTAADKSPLVVTYTITGQPVDNSYPLSYSHTLAQIAEAQAAGREVLGYLVLNGIPVSAPAIVRAAAFGKMDYSGVALMRSSGWVSVQVDHFIENAVESALLYLGPLSTYTMQFDSTTGTLDIFD